MCECMSRRCHFPPCSGRAQPSYTLRRETRPSETERVERESRRVGGKSSFYIYFIHFPTHLSFATDHPCSPSALLYNTASASRKGIVIIIVVARECGLAEKMKRRKMRSKKCGTHSSTLFRTGRGRRVVFHSARKKKGIKSLGSSPFFLVANSATVGGWCIFTSPLCPWCGLHILEWAVKSFPLFCNHIQNYRSLQLPCFSWLPFHPGQRE